MSKAFDDIPSELVKHVIAGCGLSGKDWLDNLQETVRRLETTWGITVNSPFPGVEYNYVAPARRHDGVDVVLKIAPPRNLVEIFSETEYLRTLAGTRCVRLLEEDRSERAILIERALPGRNLVEAFDGRESLMIEPAIELLRKIVRPASGEEREAANVDVWFSKMERYPGTDFPAEYAKRALDLYDRLSQTNGRGCYLHGDYHPGNILLSDSEFVLIDAKGSIGHVGYDIAIFLNNYNRRLTDIGEQNRESYVENAVGKFARAFDMSSQQVREWTFAAVVMGSWWDFIDMPDVYDGVAEADIWDV